MNNQNELQKFENDNREKLCAFLDDYNPGHDDIQIRHFIVERNGLTDYGQYKQAIAEIYSNYSALKDSYFLERKANAKIALYEAKKSACEMNDIGRAQANYYDVLIGQQRMILDGVKKQIARNMNELTKMFALASAFEEKIRGKDRAQLVREYWIANLSKQLAVNTVWKGGNLAGVMDIITTLPEDMQKPLLAEYRRCLTTDLVNQHLIASEAQAEALALKNPELSKERLKEKN